MPAKKITIRREWAWPLLLASTITLCSGLPAAVPSGIGFDKVGHFGAYGALATAIVRIRGRGRISRFGWWALVLASAYGIGDEFRQSLTHGIRTPDWHDWLADTLGAALAVSLYLKGDWYRRLMEFPVLKRKPAKLQVEISPESLPNPPA